MQDTSHFTTHAEVDFGFTYEGLFVTGTYEVRAECASENPALEGYSSWVEEVEYTDVHSLHAYTEDGEAETAVPVTARAEAVRWADENLFEGFTPEGEWESWVTETAGV
tara:strand:- start:342 stop:668 length:327 start_codon:yes stop_codon:yes gene_type:complete